MQTAGFTWWVKSVYLSFNGACLHFSEFVKWGAFSLKNRSRQHGGRRGMGFMVQCNPDLALGRQPWSLRLPPMTNRKEVCSRDGFSLFSTKRNVCNTDIFIYLYIFILWCYIVCTDQSHVYI
jgi:hypothetical protein